MNPIDALFQRLRAQGRKAFIPFLTAGDPDLSGTMLLCKELARHGASLIELGFPYSDPIADGPVIQASYTRALNKGIRIEDIFASVASFDDRTNVVVRTASSTSVCGSFAAFMSACRALFSLSSCR